MASGWRYVNVCSWRNLYLMSLIALTRHTVEIKRTFWVWFHYISFTIYSRSVQRLCSFACNNLLFVPASGRSASDGNCVSFFVCFRARYTVGYTVWRPGTEEPPPSWSWNSHTHTCNQERYAAALAAGNSALACEDHTKCRKSLCLCAAPVRS